LRSTKASLNRVLTLFKAVSNVSRNSTCAYDFSGSTGSEPLAELESMLTGLPWLIRLWRDEIPMSEEDYAAWAFPTRAEMCAVYRTAFAVDTKV